jgi:hypothetical protein
LDAVANAELLPSRAGPARYNGARGTALVTDISKTKTSVDITLL